MTMRKAFDANVPKFKPRLRAKETLTSPPPGERIEVRGHGPAAVAEWDPSTLPLAAERTAPASPPAAAVGRSLTAPTLSLDAGEGKASGRTVDDRRQRLEKIKRRVAEAARPRGAPAVAPVDPGRAAESVLGLVRDLEVDLARAREREEALRGELGGVREEAARAGAEARAAVERLSAVEAQLEEKRTVLEDLLGEMGALEAERDEALRRSQALAALDEERAKLLDDLAKRADDEARLRAEREAEVERLSGELRAGAADGARLRAGLAQLARERDEQALELAQARRERDELGSAKRALEQVHTALAQARARLG
jgi:chromosome segregation ATPase